MDHDVVSRLGNVFFSDDASHVVLVSSKLSRYYENVSTEPSCEVLDQLASQFCLLVDDLFFGENE